jgi:hypothetical protein
MEEVEAELSFKEEDVDSEVRNFKLSFLGGL